MENNNKQSEKSNVQATESYDESIRLVNTIAYWRKRSLGKHGQPMNQKELALLIDRSVDQVGRYERGSRKPSLGTLFAMCAVFKVPPQALYPDLWQNAHTRLIERQSEFGWNQ